MALIISGAKCAICKQEIDTKVSFFSTSGVFFEREDPLFWYCDTPMHWNCYLEWPERKRFARKYVEMVVEGTNGNPYWFKIWQDEKLFIRVNPRNPVHSAAIFIFETGSNIQVALDEWEYLTQQPTKMKIHPFELEVLQQSLPIVRKSFPNKQSILDQIPFSE